jgi:hypothetical protein
MAFKASGDALLYSMRAFMMTSKVFYTGSDSRRLWIDTFFAAAFSGVKSEIESIWVGLLFFALRFLLVFCYAFPRMPLSQSINPIRSQQNNRRRHRKLPRRLLLQHL